MSETPELPQPVAYHVAMMAAPTIPARIVAGADACHAIVKYVALVRLAEWRESGQGSARVLDAVLRVLGSPEIKTWHELTGVIEAEVSLWTAPLPNWGDQHVLQCLRVASGARGFRHSAIEPAPSPETAADVEAAARSLLAAAAPILCLPFVSPGGEAGVSVITDHGPLQVDPFALLLDGREGRRDVYVYERLTGSAAFYEFERELRDLEHTPPALAALLARVRRDWRRLDANVLRPFQGIDGPQRLRHLLAEAFARNHQHWVDRQHLRQRIPRESLQRTLAGSTAHARVEVMCLVGPSGIGKSCEALSWLRAEAERGRVPVWIRGGSWSGRPLLEGMGELVFGRPVAIDGALFRASSEKGVALAIDGLNEATDPVALLTAAIALARDLPDLPIRLLLTTRTESVALLGNLIPSEWWRPMTGAPDGLLRMEPLDEGGARLLWRLAEERGWPAYGHLPLATRRLLGLPIFAALAVEAGDGTATLSSVDSIVVRYLQQQTTGFDRIVLRHIALSLWDLGAEALDERAFGQDRVLAEPDGQVGSALRQLISRGVLEASGQLGPDLQYRLRFAHDRVAEWMMAQALVDRHWAREVPEGGWGAALRRVAGRSIHARALAFAIAVMDQRDGGSRTASLLRSASSDDRAAGRHAVRALAEGSPMLAVDALVQWWAEDVQGRAELVPIGAELGAIEIVARAFDQGDLRPLAMDALARTGPSDPDLAIAALSKAWDRVSRAPWRAPRVVADIGRALLQLRLADGARHANHGGARALTLWMARDIVGGDAWYAKLRRHVFIRLIARFVPALMKAPTLWASPVKDWTPFFERSPAERALIRPLIDLFAGRAGVQEAWNSAMAVAKEGDVFSMLILERALMAATRRPETSDAGFALARAMGQVGRVGPKMKMSGQSSLYVYSSWLFRPRLTLDEEWHQRAAEFRAELDAWHAVAIDPPRRWITAGGGEVSALFAAAELGIYEKETGMQLSPHVRSLWERANSGDTKLALDLLDDLAIVATTSARPELAAAALEPIGDIEDAAVVKRVTDIVTAIAGRAPELARRFCQSPGSLRRAVAANADLEQRGVQADLSLALNLDEAILVADTLRAEVTRTLEFALEATSLEALMRHVLKVAANRITRSAVFPEVDGL